MARIGRNEPCPCGSGRKFKKCCGARGAGSLTFTSEDRRSAVAKLDWMLESDEWQEAVSDGEGEFWGPLLEAAADQEHEETWLTSEDLFRMWFALDRRLPDGRTPVVGPKVDGARKGAIARHDDRRDLDGYED